MKELLFLGDSITDCGHAFDYEDLGEGYVRMIWNKFHLNSQKTRALNRGTDGYTVKNVKRFWNFHHAKFTPSVVTLLVGINDIAVMKYTGAESSEALATFEQTYDELLSQIRETCDCPIVLMEPFIFQRPAEYIAWEEDVRKMNEIIKALAEKYNCTFLPLWDKLLEAAEEHGLNTITTDGIHLTKQGQKLIAKTWLDWYTGIYHTK